MKKTLALSFAAATLLTACGNNPDKWEWTSHQAGDALTAYTHEAPAHMTPIVSGDDQGETVSFEDKDGLVFQVAVKNVTAEEVNLDFMDKKPVEVERKIDGVRANQYVFPNGYCVSGNCSPAFVALKFYKEEGEQTRQFSFAFYGDYILDEWEERVLSSFTTEPETAELPSSEDDSTEEELDETETSVDSE